MAQITKTPPLRISDAFVKLSLRVGRSLRCTCTSSRWIASPCQALFVPFSFEVTVATCAALCHTFLVSPALAACPLFAR